MVIELSSGSSSDSSVHFNKIEEELLEQILNEARVRDFLRMPIDFIELHDPSFEQRRIPLLGPFDMDPSGPSN